MWKCKILSDKLCAANQNQKKKEEKKKGVGEEKEGRTTFIVPLK